MFLDSALTMNWLQVSYWPVILVCSAVAVASNILIRRQSTAQLPSAPSEEADLLWGHELKIAEHDSNQLYTKWSYALGPLYRIKAAIFGRDIIVCADNIAAHHIFQYSDKYVKSPSYRPLVATVIGKGVVWAEGDDHKKQRKLLAPAFSAESIQQMGPEIWHSAEMLVSQLEQEISTNPVNIFPHMASCTLDILGRVAFGHNFGIGKNESLDAKAIHEAWAEDVARSLTHIGRLAPLILQAIPWIYRLPIRSIQEEGVTKTIIKGLVSKIVERGDVQDESKDILSLLIKGRRSAGGGVLTNDQFVDNVSFTAHFDLVSLSDGVVVGHETSAGTIIFTLLELARHMNVQQRLREELRALGAEFNLTKIQEIPYLDAVIKEGLRMHPSAPRTERVALQDDIIPLGKPVQTLDGQILTSLPVKAGQVFHIPITLINNNTNVWGPDAQVFSPERWLEKGRLPALNDLPRGVWGNTLTFCDGPRSCIGYRLAILEMKIIIAFVIRSLELRDTGAVIREMRAPTLQPVVDNKVCVLPLQISVAPQTH
ncbi:hypothetical protein GYMLUDRAFT_71109 [Collybiopsis luxurians FD-317 M1]|nr:hypothetical protein GYMLUDRAFT_71109 [Collybiopsis luxurians FD-317 M1]